MVVFQYGDVVLGVWRVGVLPKIMAKATPAMPRKGANLGVRSSVRVSAMMEVGGEDRGGSEMCGG